MPQTDQLSHPLHPTVECSTSLTPSVGLNSSSDKSNASAVAFDKSPNSADNFSNSSSSSVVPLVRVPLVGDVVQVNGFTYDLGEPNGVSSEMNLHTLSPGVAGPPLCLLFVSIFPSSPPREEEDGYFFIMHWSHPASIPSTTWASFTCPIATIVLDYLQTTNAFP